MLDKTVILSCLVFLVTVFQSVQTWNGANYDKARQYESSRLRLPGGNSPNNPYSKPGATSYETRGGNSYGSIGNGGDYGQNSAYRPPQLPGRDSGGYGNYGGYDANSREVNLGSFGNPSIDDAETESEGPSSSFKCKPFYSLNCERFCPAGNSLDSNGCRTCVCCPVLKCKGDCSHGVVTHGGCATCNCKTPPSHILSSCPRKWCTKECKMGFAKDSNGCPLCKCMRRQYKTKWHSKFQ